MGHMIIPFYRSDRPRHIYVLAHIALKYEDPTVPQESWVLSQLC